MPNMNIKVSDIVAPMYKDTLKDLNGNVLNVTEEEFKDYIYNDYTKT